MEENLRRKGIVTIEKMLSLSAEELRRAWGSISGEKMWHLLRGEELKDKASAKQTIAASRIWARRCCSWAAEILGTASP